MKHTGSCLCGKIKFEVEGEFEKFFLCHCERCRKDTGSAHAANLFSSTAKLTWLSGGDEVKTYHYKEGHMKSFCPHCGSAVPNLRENGQVVVVPAGCLDSDVPIKPQAHIYYAHRANWDHELEKVVKYKELPQD